MNDLSFNEIGFLIGLCKKVVFTQDCSKNEKDMAKSCASKLWEFSMKCIIDLAKKSK